jgi:DNA polymerase-1
MSTVIATEPLYIYDEEEDFRLYCCKDSHATLLAAYGLKDEMREDNLLGFYERIQQPLAQLLVKVNLRGIPIDRDSLLNASLTLDSEVNELQDKLDFIIGRPLSRSKPSFVNSEQFADFLFDEIGIPVVGLTAKGKRQINKAILAKIAKENTDIAAVMQLALDIRKKSKLASTFIRKKGIQPNWRLYSVFRIGPTTGRLASRQPNLQNWPDGVARSVVRAPKGYVFVYGDYAQLELRIVAILAQDEPLLRVFAEGLDPHDQNAKDLFGPNVQFDPKTGKVITKQRVFAKRYIYLLNYGGDISVLEHKGDELLELISIEEMRAASIRYLQAHPALFAYRARLEAELRATRRIVNVYGRPRIFFGRLDDSIRAAYNFPMQSGAADLVNTRLLQIERAIPGKLILQVHDSVMLEVKDDGAQVEETKHQLKEILEAPQAEFGGVGFPAEVKVGEAWSDF